MCEMTLFVIIRSRMSTYTVLQDIEAEDKLLGPLTLRQFIYAAIAIASGFIMFLLAKTSPFLAIPFLPVFLVFGFLAAPFGKDQPTETWAVAKVRYWFKPRKRIWDQSGQSDLVQITVPKHEVVNYTDGLSQHEVRSRLQALASTIDSRGWVVKTPAYGGQMNQQSQMAVAFTSNADSDRLTSAAALPQAVSMYGNEPLYDVLEQDSRVSQQINQMITASEQTHRQQIIDRLNSPSPAQQAAPVETQPWFAPATQAQTQVASQDEATLLNELQQRDDLAQKYSNSHLKTIQPIGQDNTVSQAQSTAAPISQVPQSTADAVAVSIPEPAVIPAVTPDPDPAILVLSRNDDLDVATIARQAKKQAPDEVVISLH